MSHNKSLSRFVLVLVPILFAASLSHAQVLVVAPHPDDDILTSSGIISRALARGDAVRIVFMTNGDINGLQTGYLRQDQAVSGETYLGVSEDHLIFLGYPDAHLNDIFYYYPNQGDAFVTSFNQSTTYGDRGIGLRDYHSYRFGVPANYNKFNILVDLKDIISTFLPQHIFVPSEFDSHLDHSTTYQLVKLAVLAVHNTNPSYIPIIHKTFVWWHDGNLGWPNPLNPTAYFAEIPNLTPETGLVWTDRESIDVPLAMESTDLTINPKYLGLLAHRDGGSFILQGFIHKDEFFWPQNVVDANRPPIVNAGLDQTAREGQVVYLDGSQSRDPDGTVLSYQWVQESGTPVQLLGPTSAGPSFAAPTGLNRNEILTFDLVVSDGQFASPPDSVNVIIQASQPADGNIAPLATVSASSETPQEGSTAVKAVDGFVGGWPGDPALEWATAGEKTGAWIRLGWPVAYKVSRLVLYDRPNTDDNIVSATINFSDGSSLAVGTLNNSGTATEYTFPAKVITSLTMTVTAVSSLTVNVGLAEMQVFGSLADQGEYGLTANVSPPGSGTVTVNPSQASYYQGQQVILTATPNIGYVFAQWSGDATGTTNPASLTINGNTSVTANFTVVSSGTLAITTSGWFSPNTKD